MTKIKLDIESDEHLSSATVQLKYKNGKVVSKDVSVENEDNSSKKETIKKTQNKTGIDSAFMQTY